MKNSLTFVAGLFAIHLSISCAHPVPSSSPNAVVEQKISNSQRFARNNATSGQDYHEAEAISEPFVLTAEAFLMDQNAFNITRSFINQFHSDPFTPASMEGPLTISDLPENITPLPADDEEVSETVSEEDHSANALESLLLDFERDVVPPSTDVTDDLTTLMPTEEPDLQYVTPFVPQDPSGLSFTNVTSSSTSGVAEFPDVSSSVKLLSERETVSGIAGNYQIPPADVPESHPTTPFELIGPIPTTSTASLVPIASAQVLNSQELNFPNQASFNPDTVAQPVFNSSENSTSTTLPTRTLESQKTSVETLYALHPSIHLQTAVRKLVDVNPFLFNPTWPAEMGFYSIPEQRVTQSFGNQRSMFQTKLKPYKRMLPEFQMDPPLYHSFSTQAHPVQLRYRQPVFDRHPRAPYPHPHDSNNAIHHRSFESASPKPRMFTFPGISSTRENFRFRVNWIDEITPAGSA